MLGKFRNDIMHSLLNLIFVPLSISKFTNAFDLIVEAAQIIGEQLIPALLVIHMEGDFIAAAVTDHQLIA